MGEAKTGWIEILAAYCRFAATQLPSGVLGAATAVDLLGAFPEACRRGLPDATVSAPELFGLLVSLGIRASAPSDRAMPAALRLVAAVCPLIEVRSPRRFTARFGAAGDPASSLAAEIRGRVTPAMLLVREPLPARAPTGRRSIRADRDRLAAELRSAEERLARGRAREAELDAQVLAAKERIEALERRMSEDEQHHQTEVASLREDAERRLAEVEGAMRRAEAEAFNEREEAERARGQVSELRARAERLAAAEATACTRAERVEGENTRLRRTIEEASARRKSIAENYEAELKRERSTVSEQAQALEQARAEADDLRRRLEVASRDSAARAKAEVRIGELEGQLFAATSELERSRATLTEIRYWVSAEPGEELEEVRDLVIQSNAHDETVEELEQAREGEEALFEPSKRPVGPQGRGGLGGSSVATSRGYLQNAYTLRRARGRRWARARGRRRRPSPR